MWPFKKKVSRNPTLRILEIPISEELYQRLLNTQERCYGANSTWEDTQRIGKAAIATYIEVVENVVCEQARCFFEFKNGRKSELVIRELNLVIQERPELHSSEKIGHFDRNGKAHWWRLPKKKQIISEYPSNDKTGKESFKEYLKIFEKQYPADDF